MDYLESALKMIEKNNKRKKKVFVSFDYTNDKHYKYLLDAWDKNKNMDFVFGILNSNSKSYLLQTFLTNSINSRSNVWRLLNNFLGFNS